MFREGSVVQLRAARFLLTVTFSRVKRRKVPNMCRSGGEGEKGETFWEVLWHSGWRLKENDCASGISSRRVTASTETWRYNTEGESRRGGKIRPRWYSNFSGRERNGDFRSWKREDAKWTIERSDRVGQKVAMGGS